MEIQNLFPLLLWTVYEQLIFFFKYTFLIPNFQIFDHEIRMATNIFISVESHYTSKLGPESENCTLLLFNPDEVSHNRIWSSPLHTPNHSWLIASSTLIILLLFKLFLESSAQNVINSNSLNSCKHAWTFQLRKRKGNRKGKGSLQIKANSNCMIEGFYGWGRWYRGTGLQN